MPEMYGGAEGDLMARQAALTTEHARLGRAQADSAEMDLASRKQMAALMQSGGGPGAPTGSMADRIESMAQTAASSGMISEAVDLTAKASTIRGHEMDQQTKAVNAQKSQLELISRLTAGVNDQPSWQSAISTFESMTGKKTGLADMPYDPQQIQKIQAWALSTKDQIDLHIKQQKADSLDATRASQIRLHKAQEHLENVRAAKIEKEGGESARMPSGPETSAASDLVTRDYIDMDPNEARIHARQIAELAGDLRRANPALRATEAMTQAYRAYEGSGALANYMKAKPRTPKAPSGTSQAGAPPVGYVHGGYRFKGGDPNSKESWEETDGGQ